MSAPVARVEGPWLGARRGFAADWVTQRWVQATGRRVDLRAEPWLAGPSGEPRGIGADYFARLAGREGWTLLPDDPDAGLMAHFDRLAGPELDASSVDPAVRDFYEHTARYELDVWSQWRGWARPCGSLLALLFSRRLEQLNIPLRPLDTARGLRSAVVRVIRPGAAAPHLTGWVRTTADRHSVVYVGAYSVVGLPGRVSPCVKVVFPLPNGNATVVMRARDEDGALVLESSGERFGDPGFYFVVRAGADRVFARYLRSFRETIRVYPDRAGELRTDHRFTLWGHTVLELHYRIRRRVDEGQVDAEQFDEEPADGEHADEGRGVETRGG